jgi:hypothetical protein
VAVVTNTWRIQVLKQKKFIFFKTWLKQKLGVQNYE